MIIRLINFSINHLVYARGVLMVGWCGILFCMCVQCSVVHETRSLLFISLLIHRCVWCPYTLTRVKIHTQTTTRHNNKSFLIFVQQVHLTSSDLLFYSLRLTTTKRSSQYTYNSERGENIYFELLVTGKDF
jgi:hypothetical protein